MFENISPEVFYSIAIPTIISIFGITKWVLGKNKITQLNLKFSQAVDLLVKIRDANKDENITEEEFKEIIDTALILVNKK